jgi:steroid delta-isomerase
MMSTSTKEQIDHIHSEWHKMITTRNLDGLMALYTDDAVIESSAVLVIEKNDEGVLKGKPALRAHFDAFFRMVGKDVPDWHRFPGVYTNGEQLIWEYPSVGPAGDQLDVVESFDLRDGLISYHRVYWGWRGFKFLGFKG